MEFSLRNIPSRYRVILCDIWGCVHDGVSAYPEAVALLQGWREHGRTVVLLTNAPRPSVRVRAQLAGLGVTESCFDAIVSSGDAAVDHVLRHHAGEALGFIGTDDDRRSLEEAGVLSWSDGVADTVVCMGYRPDDAEVAGAYDDKLRAMRDRGAVLLCFNPDRVVGHGSRTLFCAGTLADRYEAMGGKVLYFGKPHRPIYDRALAVAAERRGHAAHRQEVLAIGDAVATDVAGAAGYGIDYVLVSSGIEADRIAEIGQERFLDEVGSMPGIGGTRPIAVVGRLG
jgi:HAD superfamily hydrolase (TIGR01459 family)